MSEKSIGALWKKEKAGKTYMTGSIEVEGQKIQVVIFENSYKKESKHPDYKIFLSTRNESKGKEPY